MPSYRLEEQSAPAAPPWAPSPALQGQLFSGMTAVLAAGALSILAAFVQIREGLQPGFTLAQGFAWASLVPLVAVLRTYQSLAGELDSTGLRKSAQGLFGTVVLFQILDLATLKGFPLWGHVLIWILFGVGLVATATLSFATETDLAAPPPKKAEAKDSAAEMNRARWGGGLVLGLLVLLKLAGKGLLLKVVAVRALVNLGAGHWILLAAGLLTLLMAAFTVWFAAAKFQLRAKLGGLAVLLGVVEILLLVGYVGFYAWSYFEYETARQQPGVNLQALDDDLLRSVNGASMAVDFIWSTLTALLFWSLRARFDPDREWLLENDE